MDARRGSRARLLAPISLIAFTFALFLVVAGSDTAEDSSNGGERSSQRERANGNGQIPGADETTPEPRVGGTFYTVKTGDTLAAIAETVGVPVDRLLELNPDLDPQALVSGQKIKLAE